MTKSIKKLLSIAAAAVIGFSAFSFAACEHTHSEGEAVKENVVAATCSKEGSYDEVVYCTSCNEELSRVKKTLEKIPHTPGEKKTEDEIASSCTVAGSYDEVTYCTVCGDEVSRQTKIIDKIAHKPAEAVIENEKDATCTQKGSYDEVIYCTVCKGEISRTTKTTDLVAHKYSMQNDATQHWEECSVCKDKKDSHAHVPGAAATETTAQKCTVCNYVLAEPVGHIHSLTLTPAKVATCLTAGNKAYYTCSGCGKYFEDAEGEKQIVNLNDTVTPATGHSYSDKWKTDEKFHWHEATCEHSEEVSEKAAHTFDEGEIKGTEVVFTCTGCGYTKNQHVVVFEMNMQGMDNLVVYVNDGERVEKPENPTHEGFTFRRWYADEECTQRFDFNTPITAGVTVYAEWRGTYVFEAEDTYLDDQEGKGFSNDAYGTEMIQSDYKGMAKASGGYFVGYMYKNGVTVTFEFESNKDDMQASLILRLSGELVSEVTFNKDKYRVEVNGIQVNYSDITITGIDTDKSKYEKHEFKDFNVGMVALKKGKNIITLKVNNTDSMLGTMAATAPLLDCIKISTTAALTFEKYENPKP